MVEYKKILYLIVIPFAIFVLMDKTLFEALNLSKIIRVVIGIPYSIGIMYVVPKLFGWNNNMEQT